MNKIVLDFETYYSSKEKYSMGHMPTVLYVRDDRFKVHGVGIKVNDEPATWRTDVTAALAEIDWANAELIGHNLYFDAMVLVEIYGHTPFQYVDTLGMARALLPSGSDHDLDSVGYLLGLGTKIEGTLAALNGIRDLTSLQLEKLGEYCIQDVELTYGVHEKLREAMPEWELDVLHITTRMGVESCIEIDPDVMERVLEAERKATADAIKGSGLPQATLSSNPQYAAWLESQGYTLPTKKNPKGKTIPALGNTDAAYVRFMVDHPELKHVYEGRRRAKSRIGETRAMRYAEIGKKGKGTLPMAYKYYGAHTGRFSGSDGLNVQNLPRLDKSEMRNGLRAPEGYAIVVVDSSQIELRTQLWFSGQRDLLDKLANGDDIYSEVASRILNMPVSKATPTERGVGKAVELGGQYGMGPAKYQEYMAGGPLGLDPMFLTIEQATNHIMTYRSTHPYTVTMWKTLDSWIPVLAGTKKEHEFGPIVFGHQHIRLPNDMLLDYSGLRSDDGSWMYGVNGLIKFLWGGTLLENVIQALARVIVTDQGLEIEEETGYPLIGWTHDENLLLVPEAEAEKVYSVAEEIMSTSPLWAPDLPLAAEGGWAREYSK